MRHLHTESQVLHAFFALGEADGYVETLLQLARVPGRGGRRVPGGDRRAPADIRDELGYGSTDPGEASSRVARDPEQ